MNEKDNKMHIDGVTIRRDYLSKNFNCSVNIQQEGSEVSLKLTPAQTDRIIDVVADLIIEAARDVARELMRQAISHNTLEYQKDGLDPPAHAPDDDQLF